ncbi:hypothetical protein AAG570_005545, partial [Ranatra chinensis]
IILLYRTELLKWNGWGYNDSRFQVNNDGIIVFTGNRYPIGQLELPYFTEWVKEVLNVNILVRNPVKEMPKEENLPVSTVPEDFLIEIKKLNVDYSREGSERLIRSHGQTLYDIYTLRLGSGYLPRIPDIVTWPKCHDDVVGLVKAADECGVVVIPYGGGTSVSGAVTCPQHETRPIMALDTSQMNAILRLDEKNLLVTCEAGIIGQDLEAYLKPRGYTSGHEPDSYEFSSLGGWVATRASGMKKNVYGNIEDLVVSVKMVTPVGVLHKVGIHPRQSTGPDFNHVILGSEGTLGVVTEVVMKIRPLPKVKRYGSIVFPDFPTGVMCMREVARQRCQPASIRLMDNEQFKFGQALRAKQSGVLPLVTEAIKKTYLQYIKKFSLKYMCAATLLFEGDEAHVAEQEKRIYGIAKSCGGIPAGEKNGERGYMLTFVIAYIRDLGLEYNVVAESFETSVPWDKTPMLCRNVKYIVKTKCREMGIEHFLISHRVTQTYDSGCCVYFYFGFNWSGLSDPVEAYHEIEDAARKEVLRCGGSLSHHHGVGKLRSRWYPEQVSGPGVDLYKVAKRALDPNNIFGVGNLLPKSNL